MTDNVKREEASPEATAPAERVATARDREAKLAAKEAEKRQEIDAEFRDAVAKAAEKRDKALAKLKTGRNIAEISWNDTKADNDPAYNALDSTFRQKLDTVVQAVRETGNADVVGLEAFEARVLELVKEEGGPTGAALEPSEVPGKEEATEEAESTTGAKRGKLPDDFPHRATLEAAGYDTYAKVRSLKGDYSGVEGIGEARGKEVDSAL